MIKWALNGINKCNNKNDTEQKKKRAAFSRFFPLYTPFSGSFDFLFLSTIYFFSVFLFVYALQELNALLYANFRLLG